MNACANSGSARSLMPNLRKSPQRWSVAAIAAASLGGHQRRGRGGDGTGTDCRRTTARGMGIACLVLVGHGHLL